MLTGLWQGRCLFADTAKALSYEQQGFFEQAQVINLSPPNVTIALCNFNSSNQHRT